MNTIADSGFGCLLRSISRSQAVIDAATVYRARCGRRRAYLSEADMLDYESGFHNYPNLPMGPVDTPAWTGHFDAEQQASDIDEAKRDAAEERERGYEQL